MQVAGNTGLLDTEEPQVNLRWSDTRGASWGNPIRQGIGSTGQYLRQVQFNQLGMARDRVFELFWSATIRKADATDATKPANAFVAAAVLISGTATWFGPALLNTAVAGLTPGETYFLATDAGDGHHDSAGQRRET
jgi:hypothetical protein